MSPFHRADAVKGVEIDREKHADGNEKNLGFLLNAEPQDHERDDGEVRHVAEHLQRQIDQRFCASRNTVQDAEEEAEPPPMKRPVSALSVLTPRGGNRAPDFALSQNAAATAAWGRKDAGRDKTGFRCGFPYRRSRARAAPRVRARPRRRALSLNFNLPGWETPLPQSSSGLRTAASRHHSLRRGEAHDLPSRPHRATVTGLGRSPSA